MNSDERKDNKDEKSKFYDTATTVIGIAGAVGAVLGLLSWIGSGSKKEGPEEKMMKAPGKNGYIIRKDFENNPKDYFKDSRGKDEKSKFYDTATTVIGIAGAVGAVVGLLSWIGSGSKEEGPEEKMMKAPGKDGHIIWKDFQNNPKDYIFGFNPKDYFKDLRGKK